MNLRAVWNRTSHWAEQPLGAIIFLVGGLGLIAFYFAAEATLPMKNELESTTGRVLWTKKHKSSLYFRISSTPSQFVLYEKGDAEGKLARAILSAATHELTIRFLRSHGAEPVFLDGIYYPVYLISQGGSEFATLEEVHAAYSKDNQLGLVIGIPFVILGITRLIWFAWKRNDA